MNNAVIEVQDLHVRYGDTLAVAGTSFEVRPGEVFALLGTNGAGKTTTLDVLEGYQEPSAGTVNVFGLDPSADRDRIAPRIGIMLQEAGFFETLTVEQTIKAWRRFYTQPRPLLDTVELIGLEHRLKARVNALSGGERRRLDLGLALLGHPEILFLDEPTTGMDPAGRRDSLALVADMVKDGLTVVLTTHYLEEAEQLADRVAIMHRGRIRQMGTLDEVLATAGETRVTFEVPAVLADALPVHLVDQVTVHDGVAAALAKAKDSEHVLRQLFAWADAHRTQLSKLEVRRGSLEDVFLGMSEQPHAGGSDDEDPDEEHQKRISTLIPVGAAS